MISPERSSYCENAQTRRLFEANTWRHFSLNPYFVAVLIGIQETETGIMLLRFQQISQLANFKTLEVFAISIKWDNIDVTKWYVLPSVLYIAAFYHGA